MTVSQRPPTDYTSQAIRQWQGQILQTALYAAALFGFFALLTSFPQTLAAQITYITVYALVLLLVFLPLPYPVRAGVFLFLSYALALQFFLVEGIWSNGRAFLLFFVFMSGMLFSLSMGMIAMLISLGTMSIMAWLILSGHYIPNSAILPPGEMAHWISGITSTALLMVIALIAQHILQREVKRAYHQAQTSITLLEEERSHLEERISERTRALEQRTALLNTINQISSQIARLQDIREIVQETCKRLMQQFNHLNARIFLVDESGEYLIPQEENLPQTSELQPSPWARVGDSTLIGIVALEQTPRFLSFSGITADPTRLATTLAMPLLSKGRTIGVLELTTNEKDFLKSDAIGIFRPLADQIALAIENARLSAERQQLIEQTQKILAEQVSSAWNEFLGRRTLAYEYSPMGLKPITQTEHISDGHILSIPLRLRGREIGRITLQRKPELPAWTEKEQKVVEEVASQVALALENSRLLTSAQQRAYQERILNEITSQLSRSTETDAILQTMVRELRQLPSVSEVAVYLTPPPSAETGLTS
ncbi:MAG: GAF domain-containing protein [Anaerolineales bacterium]|nr:GAF domain-containing protein [Anaerolineales bacterium]